MPQCFEFMVNRIITKIETEKIRAPLSDRAVAYTVLFFDILQLLLGLLFALFLIGPQRWLLDSNLIFDAVEVVIIILLTLYIFDLYKPDSHVSGLRAPGRVILSNLLSFLILLSLSWIIGNKGRILNWHPLAGLFSLVTPLMLLTRYVCVMHLRHSSEGIKWLLIGRGESLIRFLDDYRASGARGGLSILSPDECFENKIVEGDQISWLDWQQFDLYLSKHWSGVILAMESGLSDFRLEQLMHARLNGMKVFALADFYEQYWLKVPIYHLKSGWFILSHGFGLLYNPIGLRFKRIFDLFFSLVLFIVSAPFFPLLAILIRIDSQGSCLFKQIRTGKNGKIFQLNKFRTMYTDAEKEGAQWASANDPRITRIGKWLRLTRIDEFPQIWNVLMGDMSFIGPRPERPVFNKMLEKEIPYYDLRHLVRPGITGWAQVLYPYGASVKDALEKLQYDIYYIKNYSLILDFAIVLKTIRVVILGRGR